MVQQLTHRTEPSVSFFYCVLIMDGLGDFSEEIENFINFDDFTPLFPAVSGVNTSFDPQVRHVDDQFVFNDLVKCAEPHDFHLHEQHEETSNNRAPADLNFSQYSWAANDDSSGAANHYPTYQPVCQIQSLNLECEQFPDGKSLDSSATPILFETNNADAEDANDEDNDGDTEDMPDVADAEDRKYYSWSTVSIKHK